MKPFKFDPEDLDDENSRGFMTWKVANPWRRLAALILDQAMILTACITALTLWFPNKIWTIHWWAALTLLTTYVSFVTQILFLWIYKNTPGKKLLDLEIQSARPNQKITFFQILTRTLYWWFGLFTLGTTWNSILSFPDRRAWHDVAAGTIVVHQNSKPDHPTVFQKYISNGWIALLSAFFFLSVLLGLLFQFQSLSTNTKKISGPIREWRSWFLLAKTPFPLEPLTGETPGKKDKEKKLIQLMKDFNKARDLSPGKRYSFYKNKMEATENEFCHPGFELSAECQTAQSMTQLLTSEVLKTLHPNALEGLRVMEKLESIPHLFDQLAYLSRETENHSDGSIERIALRAAQAQLLMKSGDFKSSKNLYWAIHKDVKNENIPIQEQYLSGHIWESVCQVEALSDCQFTEIKSCLENPYWKSWSAGCGLQTAPQVFEMSAQALGYWWGKVQTTKEGNIGDWQKVKVMYDTEKIDSFERYVIKALDFALAVKSADPKDLVNKSKELGAENYLWGWAQTQALMKFGEQWTFLVHPSEQKLVERYGLIKKLNKGQLTSASESK